MASTGENWSRREFLSTTSTLAFPAVLGLRPRRDKPNLLFLWTDEQRADTMRVYGNGRIHAPNLNKLASQSVVFLNAYVSQPVCTPSRSTVMTGLWPHQTGCTENNIPLSPQTPCLPEILNDPDYRTGYFGKWHLGDEIFPQHGFEEWVSIEDEYGRFYSEGKDRNAKSSYWHFLRELGYSPDTGRGTFSRRYVSRLPLEHSKTRFLERKACEFLERHRREPFILYVNFLEPHMPFNGPLNDEHRLDEIVLPENFDDPLEENEPLRYRLLRAQYAQFGFEGHDLSTESGWRRLIANYWGLVSQVDRSVGAILRTLDRLGLEDNTIVVYTSDHGDMMGAHRLLAKTVMYNESVRVPWLIRYPSLTRKRVLVREPVSHIDLVPTLLHLLGRRQDQRFPGESLLPRVLAGKPSPNEVFIEWNPPLRYGEPLPNLLDAPEEEVQRAFGASIRTVITPDNWKLCLSDLDKSQLFDLNRDPWETTNLFGEPQVADIVARLTDRIRRWQETVNDRLPL